MEEFDVDVGLRLRVCAWGPREAERHLVVLHGFLEQGAAWEAVAQRLVQAMPGLRVLAPDQRGFARSAHVGPGGHYHFWDYVADLQRMLDALALPVVDLLGHSMGGAVAGLFAGARPHAVRRLVLVEGLGPEDRSDRPVERGRMFLDDARSNRQHRPQRGLSEAVRRMRRVNPDLPEDVARALAARATTPTAEGVQWSWDVRHRERFPYPFTERVFCAFLREIRAPVLLVRGARSAFLREEHRRRAESLREARRIELEGAGHLPHHDVPAALAAAIVEHLQE